MMIRLSVLGSLTAICPPVCQTEGWLIWTR
ncbi:unnamed protein product [Linum tenue]|uniref:Uncharacterized protein n=1 Tax=Linum tenue TaxID=586396 RepID=A0AAV0IZM1_9ROSI|nr:unnamed protein product [Linum tenue]